MKPIWELKSIKEAASRPEFYNFMNVGMKDLLFGAYANAPSTYEQIVTTETSDKDKEGYPSLGNVGAPAKVLEGEEYPARKLPTDDFVEVTNYKFGEIIEITQELIDDDQTKKIKSIPMDLGTAHKKYEDKAVYSVITGNAACYDGSNIFAATHPGYTGGAALTVNANIYTNVTMTAGALAAVVAMVAGWTGHEADDMLDVVCKLLLVPARLKATAQILSQGDLMGWAFATNQFGPASTNGQVKNPLKELNLGVVSSPRLDKVTSGTTDWYVITDFPGLIMQWRDGAELFAENPESGVRFERDVLRWKSRERFGLKVINWRFGMKVS